jgi:hypothetical protein
LLPNKTVLTFFFFVFLPSACTDGLSRLKEYIRAALSPALCEQFFFRTSKGCKGHRVRGKKAI